MTDGFRHISAIRLTCGLIAIALMVFAMSGSSLAAHTEDGEMRTFSIDSQSMSAALKLFSEQSGVALIFDHRYTEGQMSGALAGDYKLAEAFEILAGGAGFRKETVNEHTWAVVQIADQTKLSRAEKFAAPLEIPDRRDEIVVTASYRAPLPNAGEKTLYTIESEELRTSGAQNVSEPIFELPASVSSVTSANTALLLSSNGLNLADLRGLGPERTLVLVNGRRFIRTSGGNGSIYGVDLNAIPTPFVERIEIINQGAGATLGLEAVAGAINIVTTENFNGLMLSAEGGISEEGDAGEYSFSAMGGADFLDGAASATFGVTYAVEPSLFLQDRPDLAMPYGFSPAGEFLPGYGGSSFSPNSRISGVITQGGAVEILPRDAQPLVSADGQSFEIFTGAIDQRFNWTENFSALPEIDRLIAYGSAEVALGGSHAFFAEVHAADVDVHSSIAASPVSFFRGNNPATGDSVFVPIGAGIEPVGLQTAVESTIGAPIAGYLIERRFTELGPRLRDINRRTLQYTFGFDGDIAPDWSYEVSFQNGTSRIEDLASGQADSDKLRIALNPGLCAATPQCSSVNIFAPDTIDQAGASFILADPRERTLKTREQVWQGKVSGLLYDYRGQNGAVTMGVEHRRETFRDIQVGGQALSAALGEFIVPGASGKTSITEVYGNILLPILVDAPLARKFIIGGAARYAKRSDVDGFFNISGNVQWAPIDGAEFYGQIFHGGRMPNVMELFSQGPNSYSSFFDPCGDLSGASDTLLANCASPGPLGVVSGFQQTGFLLSAESVGNEFLREETVDTFLIGASTDVKTIIDNFPGDLSLGVDWRDHRVSDLIKQPRYSEILGECFSSNGLSVNFCGQNPATGTPFIVRDPVSGQITSVTTTFLNGGTLKTNGLDARAKYFADLGDFELADEFGLDFLYTYTHRVRYEDVYEPGVVEQAGLIEFPRHQIHATASLAKNDFRTAWTVRRRSKTTATFASDDPAFDAPARTYVDMSIQWRPENGLILYGGVENLFDRDIPVFAGAEGGFALEQFDFIGRRFFAGVRAEF